MIDSRFIKKEDADWTKSEYADSEKVIPEKSVTSKSFLDNDKAPNYLTGENSTLNGKNDSAVGLPKYLTGESPTTGSRESTTPYNSSGVDFDPVNFSRAVEVIKKNTDILSEEVANIANLLSSSESLDWKTLNKEAYELFLKEEKKYYEGVIKLFYKVVAYCNYCQNKFEEVDGELAKWIEAGVSKLFNE